MLEMFYWNERTPRGTSHWWLGYRGKAAGRAVRTGKRLPYAATLRKVFCEATGGQGLCAVVERLGNCLILEIPTGSKPEQRARFLEKLNAR